MSCRYDVGVTYLQQQQCIMVYPASGQVIAEAPIHVAAMSSASGGACCLRVRVPSQLSQELRAHVPRVGVEGHAHVFDSCARLVIQLHIVKEAASRAAHSLDPSTESNAASEEWGRRARDAAARRAGCLPLQERIFSLNFYAACGVLTWMPRSSVHQTATR